MNGDRFTKLFKCIESFRHDVDRKFDKFDARFDSLEKSVDKVLSRYGHG